MLGPENETSPACFLIEGSMKRGMEIRVCALLLPAVRLAGRMRCFSAALEEGTVLRRGRAIRCRGVGKKAELLL